MNKKELLKVLKANALTLSLALSMSGCGNTNTVKEESTTRSHPIVNETTTEATTEYVEVTTEYIEPTTEVTTEEELSKDDLVLNEVKGYRGKLQEFYDNHDIDKITDKGKEYFITMADFIFYDGEIKGVKFSELKEASKEELYREFCEMDELIMVLAPNYKENISEKYTVVKDFTQEVYYKSLDKIKEYIGEERYDKVGELKEAAKEKISEKKDEYTLKLKDWYEDFRDGE